MPDPETRSGGADSVFGIPITAWSTGAVHIQFRDDHSFGGIGASAESKKPLHINIPVKVTTHAYDWSHKIKKAARIGGLGESSGNKD
jgi:hypothetical protein